jgi:hypothetical protein
MSDEGTTGHGLAPHGLGPRWRNSLTRALGEACDAELDDLSWDRVDRLLGQARDAYDGEDIDAFIRAVEELKRLLAQRLDNVLDTSTPAPPRLRDRIVDLVRHVGGSPSS